MNVAVEDAVSLGEMPLKEMRASSIDYTVVKNALVHLEWARAGNDYVYQWKMLKRSSLPDSVIQTRLAAVIDDVLPRETRVFIDEPGDLVEIGFTFYTITVKDIAERPGAQQACEVKLVEVLSKLNVWQ